LLESLWINNESMLNGSWTNSRTRKFKITHNFNDSIYTGKNINGPKKIDPYIYPSLPKGMLTFSDILREYGVGSLLPKVNSFFFIGKIYYLYQYTERNPFDIDFFLLSLLSFILFKYIYIYMFVNKYLPQKNWFSIFLVKKNYFFLLNN
jgi:hypothetical protein